jgi:hypothetical protein
MRKIATVPKQGSPARRVVLYVAADGACVFPRGSEEDGPAMGDEWYASVDEALAACAHEYGIAEADWREIADPLPHCQHDWVAPVRVRGRAEGKPRWGTFERLGADGVWREIRQTEDGTWQEAESRSESDDARKG